MDVSKLPKLSDTQKQQQSEAPPVDVEPIERPAAYTAPPATPTPVGGAEAWLSIAIGAILLFMNTRFLSYVFSRSTFSWTFNDAAGNPLDYTRTVFFWGDLALVTFALVLIAEGLILGLVPRKALVLLAFVFTVATTILNFCYVAYMSTNGYGFQLMSALAVAFGVYIAAFEWKVWKWLSARS
jgi:hypothetical protein